MGGIVRCANGLAAELKLMFVRCANGLRSTQVLRVFAARTGYEKVSFAW